MAISQVDLCNLALSRAGGQRIAQITSLGEASNEARQCAVKLPHLMRTALRSYPWRFATKKAVLARIVNNQLDGVNAEYSSVLSQHSEKNIVDQDSDNQNSKTSRERYLQKEQMALYGSSILYHYPEDCLSARVVYSATSGGPSPVLAEENERNFTVELAQDGTKLIVTGVLDAILLYTSYAHDPTVWDALFYDALAWQLAAELCVSLGNDMQKAQNLENKGMLAWDKAKSVDSRENNHPSFTSSYIKSRR